MDRILNIGRYSILCLVLLAGSCIAFAQAPSVTAAISAGKMGLQDQIQVSYTAKNIPNIRSFDNVNFSDFDVVSGPNQQVMMNNNAVSVTIYFIVQPRHTGRIPIPSMTLRDASGNGFESNGLSVEVVQGSLAKAQPRQQQQRNPFDDIFGDDPFADPFAQIRQQQQHMAQMHQRQMAQQQAAPPAKVNAADIKKDLFIRVSVDKNKVHQGEQVTASYKLYTRIPMQVGISKLPSLNGFWTQDFDIPHNAKPTEEIVDGKKYQVFLLKKSALFPQQTGTLELDPAEAEGVARIIQQVRQRNPMADMFDDPAFQRAFGSLMMNDPMFNNGFFNTMAYRDVPVNVKSTPVKITVVPMPDKGQPANYGNAVGKFTIQTKVSKTDFTTDDVAELTLTINGSGNLKLIQPPKLTLPNGLESYDPKVIDTITGRTTTISGSKIITYAITPHTPGDYEIPSIPFSYYNPQSNSYVSLQTDPIKIHVKPGKNYNPSITTGNNVAIADLHNIDVKPIKEIKTTDKPLIYKPVYWSVYGLSSLMFLGLVVYRRREEELSKDTVRLKSRRANKIALKRLVTAQKLLQQKKEKPFYEEVSKAIWLYLSDKFNIPLSSLSHETAHEALASRNIPASLKESIYYVTSECETALYAPGGGAKQMNKVYNDAVSVISELEDTIHA